MAAKAIMVQGTCSGAGKSTIVAALCRIFLQDGYSVAPFKSQNMALNSFVTLKGGEMGRAQVMQAQACRINPDVLMNPILLKPTSEVGCQVIFMGKPVGNMTVEEYIGFKREIFPQAVRAYEELASNYEIIVLEGAGNPAEVNLAEHDIVNMKMAEAAGADVLLLGDIDRGGVFASLVGTLALLSPPQRERVKGFLINKFRGRLALLEPGLDFIRRETRRQVMGVIPHISEIGLPEEDSVEFKSRVRSVSQVNEAGKVSIAVLDLPYISNFTDFDPFYAEGDVCLRLVGNGARIGQADAVIIPGSKNVISDLCYLRQKGYDGEMMSLVKNGATIVGLCGGYQMLGSEILDPCSIESAAGRAEALGLLRVKTVLAAEKTLAQLEAAHMESGLAVKGYEIHHGVSELNGAEPIFRKPGGELEGARDKSGNIWGTYIHGVFDEDGFRRWFIDRLRVKKGLEPLGSVRWRFDLEANFERLAAIVRESLQMKKIYEILKIC